MSTYESKYALLDDETPAPVFTIRHWRGADGPFLSRELPIRQEANGRLWVYFPYPFELAELVEAGWELETSRWSMEDDDDNVASLNSMKNAREVHNKSMKKQTHTLNLQSSDNWELADHLRKVAQRIADAGPDCMPEPGETDALVFDGQHVGTITRVPSADSEK